MIVSLVIFVMLTAFFVYHDRHVCVTEYEIPAPFAAKAVLISDLHNASYGRDNRKLCKRIEQLNPDMILMPGDLIDSRHTDYKKAREIVTDLCKIAPVFFSMGNHESRKSDLDEFLAFLKQENLHILRDEIHETDYCEILGLDDADFGSPDHSAIKREFLRNKLNSIPPKKKYRILLAHQPQFYDLYVKCDPDLIVSGHTHGGQIRLPFTKGLFAPGQGFFPYYDAGFFDDLKVPLIISRGLGPSRIPLRVFNDPEIVFVRFYKKD